MSQYVYLFSEADVYKRQLTYQPQTNLDMSETIAKIEQMHGLDYAPLQREAISVAANHSVMVMTGGPVSYTHLDVYKRQV